MCYNCGCDIPNDDMGKGVLNKGGGSLVDADFELMAEKWGLTIEETKRNVLKLLKKQLEEEEN